MSTSPQRLGKYELRTRLGQGGIGEVWKAFDPQFQRYFAIKILQVDLQDDPEFMTRFNRVARAVATLQHRNIVPVHDFQAIRAPDSYLVTAYIVMDYVEGPTIGEYIYNTSGLGKIPPPATIVQLFTSISAAIDYAHQHSISHRDIKPSNILLDKNNTTWNPMGEPMLTDFGLVEMLMTSSTTEINAKILNPLYMSPEQAQGYPGTERSDIYSLGIILYEVCTGMHPYKGHSPPAIMMQHISATPTPPAQYHPNIPPAVTMAILRSLTKDPAARFPSASSLAAALAEALNLPMPEMSSMSDYTMDPRNSPTFIVGTPVDGVRFEGRRQQEDVVSAGTAYPVDRVDISQSNLPGPPGTTPSSPSTPIAGTQAALSTPAFVTPVHVGQSTPTTPTGAVGGSSVTLQQGNSAPNLQAFPFTPLPGTSTPLPSTSPPIVTLPRAPKSRRKGLLIASIVALVIVLAGAGLGAFFVFNRNAPVATAVPIVGHAYFLSSGLSNEVTSQGINDELQIDIQNVPNPAAGKSYYAWLLSDTHGSDNLSLLLGNLSVDHGKGHIIFKGSQQHNNLLANYSRVLVTEENANLTPIGPSLDTSTWRYVAELPQKPNPNDTTNHYSVLNHLRHLLSGDPTLDKLALRGGLGIWLVRNVEKVQEWAGSARDYWSTKATDLMRAQRIRILDYLERVTYVGLDVLCTNPVIVEQRLAKVSLLELNQDQVPPGYLVHIGRHLKGVISAPGTTAQQRNLAILTNIDLNNVTQWLTRVRNEAKQLVNLPSAELLSPNSLSLLNDMAAQALYAYIGQLDPSTNKVLEGVIQAYYHLAGLASFEITQYKM